MAEILKVDGTRITVEPENGRSFKLKQLQGIVGGYIEIIHLRDGRLMVINEEGKLKALLLNETATALARGAIFPDDYVAGDVLVCDDSQID